MNLVQFLLRNFVKEEWVNSLGMVISSILVTILQANGISRIISSLIYALQKHNQAETYNMFKYFVIASIGYVILYQIYKLFQNKLLTKLRQWIRQQLVNALLIINSNEFSEINFPKMNSPINRVSSTVFMTVNDWLTYILPNIVFLFVMSMYFLYTNRNIGITFIVGNLLLIAYIYLTIPTMIDTNNKYENSVSDTENYLQEILNNIEKIIYRGQVDEEIKEFGVKTDNTIKDAYSFYSTTANHGTVLSLITNIIIIVIIWMLISLYYKDKLPIVTLITFITILTLYRENMATLIKQIPDTLEFIGRTQTVLKRFADMDMSYLSNPRSYLPMVGLECKTIKFENVSFQYKNGAQPILNNVTFEIRPCGGKIIGIRGKSGSGKSTLIKMLLKMNKPSGGKIYIDDKDIDEIRHDEIRKKITYVDQKGKMLDRDVVANMKYGCEIDEICDEGIDKIMKKDKVNRMLNKIMKNEGINVQGDKMSGGERQVANIIGGLIQNSNILILDEPTNAVDGDLKRELLTLIEEYKKEKECIIIISHDKDVYPLFDETIFV
jgi:ABC-type multidrug transport system fused ATPase/permease subunit